VTDKWARLPFKFAKIFNLPKFEIRNGDLPDIQNLPNFVGGLFETEETTLLFDQLQFFLGF
jgi:hypothetical protein